MCGMDHIFKCLGVPLDSVEVDTCLQWMPRISISQGINKVTCIFQFASVGTFGIVFC